MRIRLLTTLALFLLSGVTPLHASLGTAPKCLPGSQGSKIDDVKPAVDGQVITHFDAEDRDYMIRTIVFEADGEPEEGKIAVAYVILKADISGPYEHWANVSSGYNGHCQRGTPLRFTSLN